MIDETTPAGTYFWTRRVGAARLDDDRPALETSE
jgi:hypothetical protein